MGGPALIALAVEAIDLKDNLLLAMDVCERKANFPYLIRDCSVNW